MDMKVPPRTFDLSAIAMVQAMIQALEGKGIFTAAECRDLYLLAANAISKSKSPNDSSLDEYAESSANYLKWLAYGIDVPEVDLVEDLGAQPGNDAPTLP